MNRGVFCILTLVAFAMSGCDRCKSKAEAHLAAQNITDVKLQQLTQQGCAYRFSGSRNGRFCEGELNIRFAGSLAQVNQKDRCNAESKQTVSGPDLPPAPRPNKDDDKGITKRPLSF